MKVLYFADELTQSGAIKSFEEVVNSMHDIYNVDAVVCTSSFSEINERLTAKKIKNFTAGYGSYMQNSPITWWKIPIKYVLGAIKYFYRRKRAIQIIESSIDMSKIDLIHINVNRTDIGADIAVKYHIPVIMHIREFGHDDFKCWSYKRNYIDYLNSSITRFIAISNAVRDSWIARGLNGEKIKVVYNGVEHSKIEIVDKEKMLHDGELKLVIVGGVIPAKGQLQAVKALSLLPDEIKRHISLDIIGWSSKEYFAIVKKEIKRAHLEDRIRVLGAMSDVYKCLKNYHVGLMCSKAEGFGRVTVEYMHAGLGVVASCCGANPEIIHNNTNGLLYEYGNVKQLANCIIKYYNDRIFLEKMAECGRKDALEKYTSLKNSEKIFEQYNDVLKQNNL